MTRNDQQIQDAARKLFEGVAPERGSELQALWATYAPRFNILDDLSREGRFVLDAGAYRDVRFNHRALRIFWVASFAAWEGYKAVSEGLLSGVYDFARFQEIVTSTLAIYHATDPETVPLPDGIPEPGVLPDKDSFPEARAAAELAHIAAGFALLHEVQHIIHQQEGTSAPANAKPKENRREELSCDAFAISFLLDRLDEYAAATGEPANLVRRKRRLGIYFALFAMTLLTKDNWSASKSHPAMKKRINKAIKAMQSNGTDVSDAIAHTAFAALRTIWPGAPVPWA